MLLPSGYVKLLKQHFDGLVKQMILEPGVTAALLHRRTLDRHLETIKSICDPKLDLVCIHRVPDHTFPCGHGVCNVCLQIYCESKKDDPWEFEIGQCILCHEAFPPVKVKIRNPCRGLNVLSLDGGGCRGIVPLVFLGVLESRIGLSCPVQEHFDVVIGTSSGKQHSCHENRI
jgi:hypothetical protein